MNHPRSGFVNVDELMPQVSVDQVARFYGVQLPEPHRTGDEVRMRCFLNCGCTEHTGDRTLAIKWDHPVKQWKCHHYGCGKGGNLISLCDLLKPGPNMDGRPRGDRFKAIVADLRQMAGGILEGGQKQPAPDKPAEAERNLPLKDSPNERARALLNLDEKFIVDPAKMNPNAASYFRSRPFLQAPVCQDWRMGYLPRDTGGDKAGGTMRGRIVYGLTDEEGQILTWFGRDPEYEQKHERWIASGRQGREPEKVHFVKGFHRGLELYGQAALRASAENQAVDIPLEKAGLTVVEGPNDVIRLATLGHPAVGLMSNRVTKHQAEKIARLAREHSAGLVTLMLDRDTEGERGTEQALWEIAKHGVHVRLAWSPLIDGGQFANRQPESLTEAEWRDTIRPRLIGQA